MERNLSDVILEALNESDAVKVVDAQNGGFDGDPPCTYSLARELEHNLI